MEVRMYSAAGQAPYTYMYMYMLHAVKHTQVGQLWPHM